MNYSVLFPKMLKQLPTINENDMCYHYKKNHNDNNNIHIFCPQGKKYILWFLKYNTNNYSIIMEYDTKKKQIHKCYFQYLSFKEELTNGNGTLIWCSRQQKELILQKIIYWMGDKYTKPKCFDHMYDLKIMLEKYINPIYNGSFLNLKLPYMSNSSNFLLEASGLQYHVYSILKSTNYQIRLSEYMAVFSVFPIDVKKDIYELRCLKKGQINIYENAYINDIKTSQFLKQIFCKNPISYTHIEFSDNEEENYDNIPEYVKIQCIYIPRINKWKPYKKSLYPVDEYSKIKNIENKKYEHNI